MDPEVSKPSFPEVKHHKNKSMLHKRLPSKDEDGQLLRAPFIQSKCQ
jgi:hypothetical protein